jgi:DNA-binding response OmpR family regulator
LPDPQPLDGLRLLILEDEFLIAMDIEQLCRDHGAEDCLIVRSLADLELASAYKFDAAIIDVKLGGDSTLLFAGGLLERGIPFVFSTGYSDLGETAVLFPQVPVISKPYGGADLIAAVVRAVARSTGRG